MLNKTDITDAAILMVALINPIPANWKKLPCIFGIRFKKTIKNAIKNDENIFKIKNSRKNCQKPLTKFFLQEKRLKFQHYKA